MQVILEVLPDVLKLWINVLPSMLLGCFLGNLFHNTAFLHRLGQGMRPLARLGNLPAGCATSLTLCMVNRIAAYTMLAELKNTGLIRAWDVVVAFLVSALPTSLYFIAFFIGPVVISSLGWHTGVTYLSIYLGINIIVSGVGMLMGKFLLPLPEQGKEEAGPSRETVREPWREKFIMAVRRTLPAFRRLALVFIPVTLVVSILLHTPLMDQIMHKVDPALNYLGLPGVTIIVITTGVMSMVAGIGTLGPILQAGLVTPCEAITTLLITSVLHYLYEFWSGGLPTNISIFGPRLGSKVSLAALLVRESATCLALGLIVLLT
ncbi:nucleoside recognition domain-containing protein [Desulfoscipio geothermicus]|uniref:Nucleoside transporter/FeoB GTPase Gate domain-containing protein n=1 Tax=Desulfoscipio geothermicus DSM 3669 TaxID=1121426 RepID=A0A1I6D780_9FIRM|nr:nucleoside recognition domain-containing protein [Desulfoscipio geothermicus]SFR01315.1 hypothetical protein SAMN05660706_106113 [Desulfoscipio geothermicus DSM 3669]